MSNLYNKYITSRLAAAFFTIAALGAVFFPDDVFADLTIGAGETYVMAAGETLDVDGSLIIAGTGTLDASAAGVTINVSEDWDNQGTFIPGTGSTVVLDGVAQQNILGVTTFYNLTATAAAARTIGFEEDKTQTINGAATFNGAVGQLLSLRTVNAAGTVLNDSSQATIDFKGTESTDYLDVRDHIADSSNDAVTLAINPTNSTDSGNTVGWFGDADLKTLMTVTDVNGGSLVQGDTLTYTISVENIGGSHSFNTSLMQIIPPGTTYVVNSTTLNGSPVADVSGTSALVNGMAVNTPSAPSGQVSSGGAAAVATFQVTVNSNIPLGTSITAQAVAHSDEVVNDLSDDSAVDGNGDSDFENDTDVTTIVVGSAPILQTTMSVLDVNGGNLAVGDTLRYTVVITNIGNANATSVVFSDAIPANTTYSAGTILFNGAARTDASDADNADYNVTTAGAVTVSAGTLAASGGQATIKFDVTVNLGTIDGTIISSQGTVDSAATPAQSTDADGNSANGYQATTIVVGNDPSISVVMTAVDINGGAIEAGDTLRYNISVTNTGGSTATTVVLQDSIPANMTYTAGTIRLDTVTKTDADDADEADYGVTLAGAMTVDFGSIASGVQRLVSFDVTVNLGTVEGTSITNTGNTTSGNAPAASGAKTIYVGGIPGKGKVSGNVFLDKDNDDAMDTGESLSGWTIQVKTCASGEAVADPVYETTTDNDGAYSIINLPIPESYTVQAYDTNGTFYGDVEPGVCRSVVDGESVVDYDLPVDPSGFIYDSVTGDPIAGAVVEFIDVDGGHGGGAGALVPNADLLGSNTVTTDSTGFYSFVFQGGAIPAGGNLYEIRVTPPSGHIISVAHPAVTNNTTAGLLDISASEIDAPAAGIGNVDDKNAAPFNVAGGFGAQYRYAYYVRYGAGETGEVLQNNIPLDPADATFIRLSKEANKKEASVGSIVTYTVTLENVSGIALNDVVVEDRLPAGFKYLAGRVLLDGVAIADPTGGRTKTFSIGTMAVGATHVLKYQLVVGSGVSFGDYTNIALAKTIYGTVLSNRATENVKIVPDAMFDLGTVIGKVFVDVDGDGVQDRGEKPVPQVQLMTEEGTTITTDDYGRYHLAGVVPGRHVIRLVENSLPDGSILTTRKAVVIDVTEGLPVKANFGIQLPGGATAVNVPFIVTQEQAAPTLRLNAALFNTQLVVRDNVLKEAARFRIFTNYHLFIDAWTLEVVDADTQNTIWEFSGNRENIFHEIVWEARDLIGDALSPSRNYAYRLVVEGAGGRRDTTEFRTITVVEDDGKALTLEEQNKKIELDREAYLRWLEAEDTVNNLKTQQILVKGQAVKVASSAGSTVTKIRLMKGDKFVDDIALVVDDGLTAQDLLNHPGLMEKPHEGLREYSRGEAEFILPDGDYQLSVAGRSDAVVGHQTAVVADDPKLVGVVGAVTDTAQVPADYSKNIKVGDDYMLFVAMGDSKMGYNTAKGDIEAISRDDRYQEGFWQEGKLAYYLKGKIKGKYLVTSSLDTDRKRKELFRSLDPDQYYPVYGDESTVNAGDSDTQGNFFVLVEWDKSSFKWGNFNTGLIDTDLAQFNRGLYGSKVHLETVATNEHGDAKTKLIAFTASTQQRAAHNEFLGTGGSLFYLKHQDVIEGSEIVRLEVRDAVTGLVLSTVNMEESFDYTVDYNSGRITFAKPVSLMAGSDLLVSTQLLDGNPIYVVVDYSYEVLDPLQESTMGVRGQQAIGESAVVGGTYVKEDQVRTDYQLRGVDTKVYVGETTVVKAEYAETESETGGNYVSTNGGLSFTELPTTDNSRGQAYGASSESYFLDHALGVKTRYQWIENDFSTQATSAAQGKELTGLDATYDIDKTFRLKLVHDIQRLLDGGNAQTSSQTGATKTSTTVLQAAKTLARMRVTAEYRHQEVEESIDADSESGLEGDAVAARVDYRLRDGLDAYFEQQFSFNSDIDNQQTTLGLKADVTENVQLRLEEKVGSQGSATSMGATAKFKDKLSLSGDYTILTSPDGVRTTQFGFGSGAANRYTDDKFNIDSSIEGRSESGQTTDVSTISGSYQADENTEIHGSVSVNGVSAGEKLSTTTYGTKRKINETTSLTTDKSYTQAGEQKIRANSYGFTREFNARTVTGQLTNQFSQSDTEHVTSDIGSITGEINDQWAAGVSFERGRVNNLDGTQDRRNAAGVQWSYLEKDPVTGENRLKWVNKLELRLDDGAEDKQQYLIQSLLEGKANDDWTLFTKVDWSSSKNETLGTTEAMYKEFSLGAAYRPVDNDRLNMLAKYSLIEDDAPVSQIDVSDINHERFQVLALEGIYDLTYRWQLAEKIAYKWGEERVAGFDTTETQTWLWANRVNYRISEYWTAGAEYRYLAQKQADDNKQGMLVEVTRRVGEFIDVGAGYNFTDFNDDLTHLDYTVRGPYVRVTGTLYDRTPEEKARAREKWMNQRVEAWAYVVAKQSMTPEDYRNDALRTEKVEIYKNAIHQRVTDEMEIRDLIRRADKLRKAKRPARAALLDMTVMDKLEALKKQSKIYPSKLFQRGFMIDIDKEIDAIRKRSARAVAGIAYAAVKKQELMRPQAQARAITITAKYKQMVEQRVREEQEIRDILARAEQARKDNRPARADLLELTALNRLEKLRDRAAGHPVKVLQRGFVVDIEKTIEKIRMSFVTPEPQEDKRAKMAFLKGQVKRGSF